MGKIKWNQMEIYTFIFVSLNGADNQKHFLNVGFLISSVTFHQNIRPDRGCLSFSSSIILSFRETYAFRTKLWNNHWKKLNKYFQDKPGDLTVSKSSTDKKKRQRKRDRDCERERQFPIQTCCLRANGRMLWLMGQNLCLQERLTG